MKPQGFGQMGGGNLEDLGWNDMGFEPPKPAEAPRDEDHDAFGEDVVEHPRAHPTGLTPIQSPVHSQQAEIADRFSPGDDEGEEELDPTAEIYDPEAPAFEAEPEEEEEEVAFEPEPAPVFHRPVKAAVAAVTPNPVPRRAPRARSVAGAKGKAAFTLRLDPSRHLKLRLACAVNGRSAQQLVTDALDRLLTEMPELDAMAEKANRKG
jgi:predicted HicB family RNase H-like nuclease